MRRSIVCHDFNALPRAHRHTRGDRQTDADEDAHGERHAQIGAEAAAFVAVSKKHRRRIYFSASDAAAVAAAAIRPFSRHAGVSGRLTEAVSGVVSGQCDGGQCQPGVIP